MTAWTSEIFWTNSVTCLPKCHSTEKIENLIQRDAIVIRMTKLFERPDVFNERVSKSFELFDVSNEQVTKPFERRADVSGERVPKPLENGKPLMYVSPCKVTFIFIIEIQILEINKRLNGTEKKNMM